MTPSQIVEELSRRIATSYELDPFNISMIIAMYLLDNNIEISKKSNDN